MALGLFFQRSTQVFAHDISGMVIELEKRGQAPQFAVGEHMFIHANFAPGQELADCAGICPLPEYEARA